MVFSKVSGKTYQLFDYIEKKKYNKYFITDVENLFSVKVDGQNTAVMRKEDGTCDFMVRFEVKKKSHNEQEVTDKTKGVLKTIDGRLCWIVPVTLHDGKSIDEKTLYEWHCFHLDEIIINKGEINEETIYLPFRNHMVGYISLPKISTYKHIQDVVSRNDEGEIIHINYATLDCIDGKIHMKANKIPINEFMIDKEFVTCELMAGDPVCKRKYALPENTMTFVIIHGAIPVPEEMCPKELNYDDFTSWFNSGDAKGDEYNCFADQEGIVIKQENKYFKVRHGSRVEKDKFVGDEKKWNSKNGCGIVFDVSEILKQ
jgi:hypothetical protein